VTSETMPVPGEGAETSLEWSVKDAVDLFFKDGKRDGDLLSHDWILFALDMRTPETREEQFELLERMDAFRTALLREHCIALQNVRGEGYRIVPPGEQAEYAARRAESYVRKGARKGGELLKNIRRDQLTHAEARRHTDCEVKMAALSGMVSKGARDIFSLFAASK
jgi:hypothetical protein